MASEPPVPAVSLPASAASEEVLAKLRKILDEQRQKQHIPGLALVVVKDDKVVFLEALGLRDRDRKLPVTPETVFPIGSCTKSFTSIAAAESHDRGVLSLDDSPHKFLAYFHMADPEADKLVTLRDMLCHRTGLRAYADLAAEPAVLSRTSSSTGRFHRRRSGPRRSKNSSVSGRPSRLARRLTTLSSWCRVKAL